RPGPAPPDAQPWRSRRDRGLCLLRLLVGAGRGTLGEASLIRQGPRLLRQCCTARLELEEDSLGRLAGEPQLAPLRVVAVPVARDRRYCRAQQLVLRDDGKLGNELDRIASREHAQRAEPGGCGPLEQLQRSLRRRRDERRGTGAERGRDRALRARLDLDQRQREALALLGKRTRRRRDSLSLRQRAFARREPLLRGERA